MQTTSPGLPPDPRTKGTRNSCTNRDGFSCSLDLLPRSHLRWGKGVLLGEQCAGRIGWQMRPAAMVRRIWWLHRCCCCNLTPSTHQCEAFGCAKAPSPLPQALHGARLLGLQSLLEQSMLACICERRNKSVFCVFYAGFKGDGAGWLNRTVSEITALISRFAACHCYSGCKTALKTISARLKHGFARSIWTSDLREPCQGLERVAGDVLCYPRPGALTWLNVITVLEAVRVYCAVCKHSN